MPIIIMSCIEMKKKLELIVKVFSKHNMLT